MNSFEIRHYIITRFNMPWVNGEGDSPRGINPEYLKERLVLFDKYTVPSLVNQTCKNFRWLVFYDVRTPVEFLEKIESYKTLGFYEPIFVEPGFSLKDYLEELKVEIGLGFVTSRVDNDDALMPDYVETVQKKAMEVLPEDKYLTSILNYRYDENDKTLTKYKQKKNHFISRTGNVFEVNQNHMPTDTKVYVKIPGIHSIEVVHESNLYNNTKYTLRSQVGSTNYNCVDNTNLLKLIGYSSQKKFIRRKALASFPQNTKKTILRIKGILKKYCHG